MTDNSQTEDFPNPQTQYDSPWKDVLERYFEDFMLFFFPQAHLRIDWTKKPEFLDKELLSVVGDAEIGTRFADKLVKVYRISGEENWILIHVEIQSQEEANFSLRMYTYNYRIYDKYQKFVVSLAILGDDNPNWRPSQFNSQLFGCGISFRFPVIKLLDYEQRLSELEQSRNPFATVVMAHLQAKATTSDRTERKQQKLILVKRLYELGFERDSIIVLFKFIDWMMTLPANLAQEFWQEYSSFEESKRMQYVTSVERIGIEKGTRKGLLQGIDTCLQLKFGAMQSELFEEISQIQDIKQLETILTALKTVNTVEKLREIYQPITE
ncbi:cytosolic protein [Brunnivagina elsteri]|uniref:Cytosolic protein n=1 Tax=Brunnivagina elsteri CCALA 953 TaxID=987040 RepID=A0A2A2TJ40_9CYAN|nr:cytosolic protein [Calothrix elsteri]PAX54880.1 cytosolic protein [Calothrix elsteri CCALA 953]